MKIIKQPKAPSGLAIIRKRLGLSQEQLASQLGIHRSSINMAEQGKRSLPTAVHIQLANMEILLNAQSGQTIYEQMHPAEKPAIARCKQSYDRLFAREARCRINSNKLAGRLALMTGLYRKTREWLQVIETTIKENKRNPAMQQLWQRQQQQAIKTLHSCGQPAQVLLKSRISLLEAEAALYKKMKLQLQQDLPGFFY